MRLLVFRICSTLYFCKAEVSRRSKCESRCFFCLWSSWARYPLMSQWLTSFWWRTRALSPLDSSRMSPTRCISYQLAHFCLSSSEASISFSQPRMWLSFSSCRTLASSPRQTSLQISIFFYNNNHKQSEESIWHWVLSPESQLNECILLRQPVAAREGFGQGGQYTQHHRDYDQPRAQYISVLVDTTAPDSSPDLEKLPIDKVFVNPKKIGSSLASVGKKPDMALFNSYQLEQMYSIFMYSKWNKCPRILEINQLWGLEAWRKKNYLTLGSPFLHEYDALSCPAPEAALTDKFLPEELQSIKCSDYFLCSNDFISNYLRRQLQVSNMIVHSMGIPQSDFLTEIADLEYREFRHRKNFAFLGNLTREKNVEMIDLLVTSIWPSIRTQLPNVELHLYGAGFNKGLQGRRRELEKQGIVLKGYLDDMEEIQRYRALLYPIQYSTGTKGGIVESWYQHTPVVTTPVGAEGLFVETSLPMFSANARGQVYDGFFKERALSQEEESEQKRVEAYYGEGRLSQKLNKLSFGGLCNSFTYAQFVENAIRLYSDETLWKQCLLRSRASFLKHHSQLQMEVNLGFGLSQVELAVYESRRKKEYNEEWDMYIKSKEGYNKLHERSK